MYVRDRSVCVLMCFERGRNDGKCGPLPDSLWAGVLDAGVDRQLHYDGRVFHATDGRQGQQNTTELSEKSNLHSGATCWIPIEHSGADCRPWKLCGCGPDPDSFYSQSPMDCSIYQRGNYFPQSCENPTTTFWVMMLTQTDRQTQTVALPSCLVAVTVTFCTIGGNRTKKWIAICWIYEKTLNWLAPLQCFVQRYLCLAIIWSFVSWSGLSFRCERVM